jgi:integrase
MAPKIKPNPSGKYPWLVEWREGVTKTGAPKRCRKYFVNAAQAKTFAREKRTELATLGAKATPWSALERAAIEEARAARIDPLEAVRHFAHLKAEQAKSVPVGEAVEERLRDAERRFKPSTVTDTRYRLNALRKTYSEQNVRGISRDNLEKWITERGSTQNQRNFWIVLHSFWEFCISRGWAGENLLDRIPKPGKSKSSIQIFAVEQLRTLLHGAEPEILPALAIMAFAGLRRSEVMALQWEHVRGGHIEVTADNAKSARRRLVTICPALREWLLWEKLGNISHKSGALWPGRSNAYRRARKLVTPWPHNALRHSFASYHLALNRDAASTALELGHSSTAMLWEHYRELVTQKEAEAWFSLTP